MSDRACMVSTPSASAGATHFELTNLGSDLNEFEILAEDQLRIIGEKENVPAGSHSTLVVELDPGTYYTACRFQQIGEPVGLAKFVVGGRATARTTLPSTERSRAIANYEAYIRSQTAELVPAVDAFASAYRAGDDQRARDLFAPTRLFYERIEPTAESFANLDPKLDSREVDALANARSWTGFHRIEKDLWPPGPTALNSDGAPATLEWTPSSTAERGSLADSLVENITELDRLVRKSSFHVSVADISNGAVALLDEVAKNKITGEEDWWSHTDLSDFAGNVQGARVAVDGVGPLVRADDAHAQRVLATIRSRFDTLAALLARYGSVESGFVSYETVDPAARRQLSNAVTALAEPMSSITALVVDS